MPPKFHSDIRQFPTPAAFAAYLSSLPPPTWHPVGSTAHNTYRPLASQWVGKPSMLSMIKTYKAKEWDRGPHLYFVVGAPNPKHDGIWMMTPLSMYGIHAGACNFERFGCELVGDFQDVPPSAALQNLFIEGTAALHRWANLGATLNAHRDCMAGRTCPGNAMYAIMPQLRARLAAALAPPVPPKPTPVLYRAIAPMYISETPSPRGPVALQGQAVVYQGDTVVIDEVRSDGWCHTQDGVGFLPIGGLEMYPITTPKEPS